MFEMEEYIEIKEIRDMISESCEAYSEQMLIDCQNGKPCSYGICDECPNTMSQKGKDDE